MFNSSKGKERTWHIDTMVTISAEWTWVLSINDFRNMFYIYCSHRPSRILASTVKSWGLAWDRAWRFQCGEKTSGQWRGRTTVLPHNQDIVWLGGYPRLPLNGVCDRQTITWGTCYWLRYLNNKTEYDEPSRWGACYRLTHTHTQKLIGLLYT